MGDLYDNWAELEAAETEGVDYTVTAVTPAGATWSSIAIHGGGIEAGSGEMAEYVSGSGTRMRYYQLKGLKTSGNQDLHITSSNYDEPSCVALQAGALRTLSFHGYTGVEDVPETALGGLDLVLGRRVRYALESAGFRVADAPSEIAGDNPDNICNLNLSGAGVQLEMSRAQRAAFFPNGDLSRAMRESGQRTATFYRYAAAVLAAFQGYGQVSLGSINVSRWTTVPAPSANVDLVASVATNALATGGGQFLALTGRWADVNNCYLARVEFSTSQGVLLTLRKRVASTETSLAGTFTSALTHAAGARYWVRFQITGTTLRARVWPWGGFEPNYWQITATDSDLSAAGSVGMRSILSSTNTNSLPVLATWGDLSMPTPQTLVVTRSTNGIVKAHSAGADIRLARPAIVAL